jgi:Flp pilus assembly pilin Flp
MVNPLRSPMTVYLKAFLGAHAGRLRVHWRAGERGASAVELAIITGALVVVAAVIIGIIYKVVGTANNNIQTTIPNAPTAGNG